MWKDQDTNPKGQVGRDLVVTPTASRSGANCFFVGWIVSDLALLRASAHALTTALTPWFSVVLTEGAVGVSLW